MKRISSISSDSLAKERPPEDPLQARRKAMREFYKVQNTAPDQLQAPEEQPTETTLTPQNFDRYVEQQDFITLLKQEDEILEELSNNQSEIKSIIYNNYYELIKINDMLMNLKERNATAGDTVEDNLRNVKKSLSSLEEIDIDVFGTKTIDETELLGKQRQLREQMSTAINRLILNRQITKEQLSVIEKVLPQLRGESVILEINEIKERPLSN